MHDGVPAHFSRALQCVPSNTYHDRSIGLNPLNFYLWGHLKTIVYAAPVDNEEALHRRIMDACQTIRNYPGIFERMRLSMMRRVEAFTESHGGHFENLL
jgi:hypothetical protein